MVGWSATMNALVSKRCLEELNSPHGFAGRNSAVQGDALKLLPRGHVPLRAMQWTAPVCNARARFSVKLFPVEGIGAAIGLGGDNDRTESAGGKKGGGGSTTFDPYSRSTPPIDRHSAKTVGYLWCVSIYSANGTYSVLEREGECLSQNQMDLRGLSATASEDGRYFLHRFWSYIRLFA